MSHPLPVLYLFLVGILLVDALLPPVVAKTSEPASSFPDEDPDNDGLTNQEEAEAGSHPTNPDTDGDAVGDGEDGWPRIPELAPRRLPRPHFALIDLGAGDDSRATKVNNRGDAIGYQRAENPFVSSWGVTYEDQWFFWRNGILSPILSPVPETPLVVAAADLNNAGSVAINFEPPPPEDLQWAWAWGSEVPVVTGHTSRRGAAIWHPDGSVTELAGPDNRITEFLTKHQNYLNPYEYESLRMSNWVVSLNDAGVALGGASEYWVHVGWDWVSTISKSSAWLWPGGAVASEAISLSGPVTYDYGVPSEYFHGFFLESTSFEPRAITTPGVLVGQSHHQPAAPLYGDIYPESTHAYFVGGQAHPLPFDEDSSLFVSSTNHLLGKVNGKPAFLIDQAAGHRADQPTGSPPSYGQPILWPQSNQENQPLTGPFNTRFQIVQTDKLWQNGVRHNLNDLTPLCRGTSPQWKVSAEDISDNGIIAASMTRIRTPAGTPIPPGQRIPRAAMLVPCDLAVDSNRDGAIKFAGNFNDQSVAGKPSDKTDETKPFRFWCNDDNDGTGEGAESNSGPGDSSDNEIKSFRDLEDFTRLHLYLGGLQDAVANGMLQVGLEWRNTTGSPSIKVYRAGEPTGGDEYLRNDNNEYHAALQTATPFKNAMGTVDGAGGFKFPSSFWQATGSGIPAFGQNNPTRYMLFEGVTEGKGQLVITIWKGTEKIGEGPGVWLDLLNIKKMYERAKGTPFDGLTAPFESYFSQPNPPPTAYVEDPNGHVFSKPHDEDDSLIVFVHGIHGPGESDATAYNSNINAAQTVFKRLWHQGFKGRFAFYKWPALTPGPSFQGLTGFEYNNSEYRAWKYGRGLAQFVNSFDKASKNLFAHSQGNNVCGAAVAVYGLTVNNYVLSQAAVAAGCYDVSGGVNNYQRFLQAEATKPTPDLANDLGYRGYLATLGVTGNVVNFHNFDDFALASGFTGPFETNWEKNQEGSKPDDSLSNGNYYVYTPTQPIAQRCYLVDTLVVRPVLDPHESMALVARARSKAVGALGTTGGSIKDSLDLSQMRDGSNIQIFTDSSDDHGAQVSRRIQQVWPYYEQLGIKLEVIPLLE